MGMTPYQTIDPYQYLYRTSLMQAREKDRYKVPLLCQLFSTTYRHHTIILVALRTVMGRRVGRAMLETRKFLMTFQ